MVLFLVLLLLLLLAVVQEYVYRQPDYQPCFAENTPESKKETRISFRKGKVLPIFPFFQSFNRLERAVWQNHRLRSHIIFKHGKDINGPYISDEFRHGLRH